MNEPKPCFEIPRPEFEEVTLGPVKPIVYTEMTADDALVLLDDRYGPQDLVPYRTFSNCFPGQTAPVKDIKNLIRAAGGAALGPSMFENEALSIQQVNKDGKVVEEWIISLDTAIHDRASEG